MGDRRFEARTDCAEEITVQWQDQKGQIRKATCQLKDMSLSGACLRINQPIPWRTSLRITQADHDVTGKVRHCVSHGGIYYIGVRLDAGCQWRPQARTAQI